MEVPDFPTSIDPTIDYEKILPIHQKRIIAFINNFITNTVSFLNTFAQSCESRFMEFEYKMQKVEASLLILESQLSSISGLDNVQSPTAEPSFDSQSVVEQNLIESDIVSEEKQPVVDMGPKASEDPRFVKFFKMLQFGVPLAAVKHKMSVENLDPDILDNPGKVVPIVEER